MSRYGSTEIFKAKYERCLDCGSISLDGHKLEHFFTAINCDPDQITKGVGWFYWSCFPGCLPDSDPFGPFESERAAIDDADDNGFFDNEEIPAHEFFDSERAR